MHMVLFHHYAFFSRIWMYTGPLPAGKFAHRCRVLHTASGQANRQLVPF